MGACASSHHKASPMKAQISFDSTKKPDHKVVVHPSPAGNEKFPVMNGHVAVKPQLPRSQSSATVSDFGSKEETFFDSQAWMDSDYDDDFMSVNGDFTPSRGNTPVHHILTTTTTQGQVDLKAEPALMDRKEPVGSALEPSLTPSVRKMRLLDLFKESVREEEHDYDNEIVKSPQKDGLKSKSERYVMGSCFSNLLYVRGSGRQNKKSIISSVVVG